METRVPSDEFMPELEDIEDFEAFVRTQIIRSRPSGELTISADVLRMQRVSPAWATYLLQLRLKSFEQIPGYDLIAIAW